MESALKNKVGSFRTSEQNMILFKRYAEFHGQTVSDFVVQATLEKIEDEHDLDALRKAIREDSGERYTMKEIAEELGFDQ